MPTNDQIILTKLLEERKREVAPELREADFFEVFAAEQVLKNYDISNDEIDEGIVGDGGDGGIDSVHVFINGELLHEDSDLALYKGDVSISIHIIQAKRSGGFSEETIHRFRSSCEDLFDLSKTITSLSAVYNQKLLTIVNKFREAHTKFASKLPPLSFHFYYATTATEVHPNVQRQVESLKGLIGGLFSSADFTFDFLGAKDILELARSSPSKTYQLKLSETPISSANSFICLVTLSDYLGFIIDENKRLRRSIFDANVRDYQGDIEVNRGIRTSLLSPEGEDFWWLNNGITIISDEATHSGKSLTIKNPQIVNGLQTSQEIYHAFHGSSTADGRCLLVRVLVPTVEGSYQRIVRATNSQTSVSPASLRATDPLHRNIEDYLKAEKLYYDRRKNYYKNEGRPRNHIISVPYLAQAVMATVLGRPDSARARPSTLLKSDADYQKIFSADYPIGLYLFCAKLMKKCEAFLRSKSLEAKDVNNLKFHLAMCASRIAVNEEAPTPAQLARISFDAIDDALLENCFGTVNQLYEKEGGTDQASKGPKLVDKINKSIGKKVYRSRLVKVKSS